MVYNMTEKQGESFTKVVLKKAGRAKERLLQNFGKADRTTDELFELYENNFNKQQNSAIRIQKEVKNYVSCIRSMQAASKNLMDCIADIYEPEWPGHEQIPFKAQNLEALWEELCTKMNDQVTIPLSTYLSQFSEIKAKIDKRGRKLVDYDGSRHALEAVQNNHKKKDELKLSKLRDDMEGARRLYDVLNKELHEELPALYDSRIPFLISVLQTLFATQSAFYGQCSRIETQLNNYVDELALEAQKGTYHINARLLANNFKPNIDSLSGCIIENHSLQSNLTRSQQQLQNSNYNMNNSQVLLENTAAAMKYMAAHANTSNPNLQNLNSAGSQKIMISESNSPILNNATNAHNQTSGHENHPDAIKMNKNESSLKNGITDPNSNNTIPNNINHKSNDNDKKTTNEKTNGIEDDTKINILKQNDLNGNESNLCSSVTANNQIENILIQEQNINKKNNLYEIPAGVTTKDLPSGVFYKVKSTYRYTAEDEDELNFEVGEIIYVIEYDNPEEQEDGWLMGCKESTGEKGLFPANFTRPI